MLRLERKEGVGTSKCNIPLSGSAPASAQEERPPFSKESERAREQDRAGRPNRHNSGRGKADGRAVLLRRKSLSER